MDNACLPTELDIFDGKESTSAIGSPEKVKMKRDCVRLILRRKRGPEVSRGYLEETGRDETAMRYCVCLEKW